MMSTAVTVHGRPSAVHEVRVDVLKTLGTLGGHVNAVDVLADGSRPDVALVRPTDRSIFLGDAKATETAGNAETRQRLRHYTTFLGRYVAAGGSGVFALAVPVARRYDWLRLLEDVCEDVAPRCGDGRLDLIDTDCVVVWQAFAPLRPQVT